MVVLLGSNILVIEKDYDIVILNCQIIMLIILRLNISHLRASQRVMAGQARGLTALVKHIHFI